MQKITYKDVEVDRCTNCYGIWFDEPEHEDLKKLSGSEVIDIGDVDLGRKQNEKTDIICPKCNKKMLVENDDQQIHIQYEKCPSCQSVYFDAGEFRDFKQLTIKELFRSIFSKKDK